MIDTRIYTPNIGKAVTIDQFNNDNLWSDAYYGESRNKPVEISESKKYRHEISTIYRCIDLRAGAISQIPYVLYSLKGEELTDRNNFWKDKKFYWLSQLSGLLYLTEASLLLSSEAFWLKENTLTGKQLGFRWLAAPYITPLYDAKKGLTGFERVLNIGGEMEKFEKDELVYFLQRNPLGELIPDFPQALAAAKSADVIMSYESFVENFYKRGAVKATILKVDRSVSPKERNRLREFWEAMLSGEKNAYTTEVVSGDVSAEVIGEGAGDSEKTEVLRDRRKDIATAMGVPYSLLFGDSSASYTAGPTEELNFLKYTIQQRISLIEATMNEQILVPQGLRIRFYIEHLPAFKDFGDKQVDIYKKFIDTLLPASLSARLSGLQLPDGVKYEDLDKFVAEERERQFREKERIVTLNSKLVEGSGEKPKEESKAKPNPNASEDNNLKIFEDEVSAYKKWLRNRKWLADPLVFKSDILSEEIKLQIYNSYWQNKSFDEEFKPNEF